MDTVIVRESLDGLFVIGLIISVIIAYGVQFLLSLLSLATGVSLTPNLKKKSAEMKAAAAHKKDATFAGHDDDNDDHDGLSSTTVTSGIGAWVLVTSSVALFAGAYLGLSIVPITTNAAIVAGIVIWALFFITLLYIEYRAVHTIVGGLVHSALGGLRYSSGVVGSLLSPSKSRETEKQARNTVRAVYREVDRVIRKDNVDKRLARYIDRLTPEVPTKNEILRDLRKFINHLEIQERTHVSDDDVERILDVQIKKGMNISKEDADRLRGSLRKAKTSADGQDANADKVMAVIDSIAPVSDEEARQYRAKIAQILDKTSKDELNAEAFRGDLEKAFDDPKAGRDQLIARLKHLDRPTIKEIVNQLNDLDPAKSDRMVDMVLDGVNSVMGKAAGKHREGFRKDATMSEKVEARIAAYFNGLNEPGLNYDLLKNDVQQIFEEPTSAPDVVRNRLQTLDRRSVVKLLESNPRISHEQAERIADGIIKARDDASNTLDSVQQEATRRLKISQRRAVIAAEAVRRNTIVASWWLVGSATVSVAAAILGSYLTAM